MTGRQGQGNRTVSSTSEAPRASFRTSSDKCLRCTPRAISSETRRSDGTLRANSFPRKHLCAFRGVLGEAPPFGRNAPRCSILPQTRAVSRCTLRGFARSRNRTPLERELLIPREVFRGRDAIAYTGDHCLKYAAAWTNVRPRDAMPLSLSPRPGDVRTGRLDRAPASLAFHRPWFTGARRNLAPRRSALRRAMGTRIADRSEDPLQKSVD